MKILSSPACALLRAAVIAATLSTAAWSVQAAPASEASVQRLVKAMRVERSLEAMMANIDRSIVDAARKKGLLEPDLVIAEKYARKVGEVMREEVKLDEFQSRMAEIYRQLFTEKEVRALIAFYESPTGQSLVAKTPEMVQQSGKVAQDLLGRAMPRVQALISEMHGEMRDRAAAEAPAQPQKTE